MPAYDEPGVVRRAQVVDLARAVPLGVLLPLETSVLLTIAVKHFDASWWEKWLVAAGNGVGLLAAPLITSLARRRGRPVMLQAGLLAAVGAVGLLLAAAGSMPAFVVGSVIAIATVNVVYPLTTATYERNFPPTELGRRVGWGMSLKVLVSAVVGLGMGWFLTGTMELPGGNVVPIPVEQTATVKLPNKIKPKGKTVLLKKPVITNAGQKATAKLSWSTKKSAKGKKAKYANQEVSYKTSITTTGRAKKLYVKLVLKAPAIDGYTAYSFTKKWTVKK